MDTNSLAMNLAYGFLIEKVTFLEILPTGHFVIKKTRAPISTCEKLELTYSAIPQKDNSFTFTCEVIGYGKRHSLRIQGTPTDPDVEILAWFENARLNCIRGVKEN